ncbi:hypothetical protein [Lysobacter gummosus]|uniref:hypothetical protein n=1 Tax=Lysobacter gummosus TaxID=262324 RepID=UPI0036250812
MLLLCLQLLTHPHPNPSPAPRRKSPWVASGRGALHRSYRSSGLTDGAIQWPP